MPALNHFGLDIGTHSIKGVQLGGTTQSPTFIAAGQYPTPQGAMLSESEEDLNKLAETVKSLHREAHISTNKVVAALPESQIFTRVVELPQLSKQEIESAIQWEAEQYVPLPLSEVRLTWQILSTYVGVDKKTKVSKLIGKKINLAIGMIK